MKLFAPLSVLFIFLIITFYFFFLPISCLLFSCITLPRLFHPSRLVLRNFVHPRLEFFLLSPLSLSYLLLLSIRIFIYLAYLFLRHFLGFSLAVLWNRNRIGTVAFCHVEPERNHNLSKSRNRTGTVIKWYHKSSHKPTV